MMAHLSMSLGQTLFHRYLGHSRLGGRFFKNHIQFHHVHYAGDHVVSAHYLDNGDNNTLFFLIPVVLVVGFSYLFLRSDLLVIQLAVMSLSFCGHYYVDNQYHVAGSWLGRFSWFRRKQPPFHPPPPWELQFRGDRFLLGSASRHLSSRRVWKMSPNICCVTATSAN